MKNKVLKLCKRLNKVTASEIAPILMLDEKRFQISSMNWLMKIS